MTPVVFKKWVPDWVRRWMATAYVQPPCPVEHHISNDEMISKIYGMKVESMDTLPGYTIGYVSGKNQQMMAGGGSWSLPSPRLPREAALFASHKKLGETYFPPGTEPKPKKPAKKKKR